MSLTQFWKLNEASGTSAVATTGTNGTYARNATNTTSATGPGTQIVACQSFNGTSDQITVSAGSYAPGAAFSISIWFTKNQTTNRLMFNGTSDVGRIITLDTTIRLGSATNFTTPSQGTGASTWHHLLVTRTTGNSARVFLDGVESSTGAQSFTDTFAITKIGLDSTANWSGKLAWVKFFDDDESANVAALYAERNLSVTTKVLLRRRREFAV